MRPVKLTMSAFGPYAGVETIEFDRLESKNIFLITGPTGAGKTTIFDAISFALFGEASGSSRDKDAMRSDFASIDVPTFVELEFELKGKRFNIVRYPQQERKKAKGEGTVFKTSEACLTTADGDIITKINAVDEKVSSLIGINKNQFRQIVMLPQGEFRKLLEAESKEREVIFRKIFGTEAFQIIQQKLDNLSKEYYKKIKEGETKRAVHIKNISAEEDEVLLRLINAEYLNVTEIVESTKELVQTQENLEKQLSEDLSSVKQTQAKLMTDISKAEEVNNKLTEKKSAFELYNSLKDKEQQYKENTERLAKGRKTLQVKLIEDALTERKKSLELRRKDYEISEIQLKEAEQKLLMAQERLKQEESKQGEKAATLGDIAKLKDKEAKVKALESKRLSALELRKTASQKGESLQRIKLLLNDKKTKLNAAKEQQINIKNCELERAESVEQIKEKKLITDKLRELREKINQYASNLKEHETEAESYGVFEREFIDLKHRYEMLQDNYLKAQAGILARELKEGCRCPVCGSTTHPNPAVLLDEVPSEQELKLYRESYNAKQEEKSKWLEKLSSIKGKLEEGKRELKDTKERLVPLLGETIAHMKNEEIKKYINEAGPKLKAELDKLEARKVQVETIIAGKQETENLVNLLEGEIKTLEERVPSIEEEYKTFFAKAVGEEELLRSYEEELPEEIRSIEKLMARIDSLQLKVNNLEKSYTEAQQSFNAVKNFLSSSKAEADVKLKNIELAEKEVIAGEASLAVKLSEYGFSSHEEYKLAVMSDQQLQLLEKDINNYYQRLQSAQDSYTKYESLCAGLVEVDISGLKEALKALEDREKALNESLRIIFSKIKNNLKVLKEIEKINAEINGDEEKYGVINDISKTANGFNEERITFERYVLAAYFDEIISAANLRLSKMTGNRFILKRKEEKGKGTKQEGLELEVFDNYTGKCRHVKTLSGGESFKASLALALGLADVVQAYAGGISLDTMFVDEGFGTLDPESLDNAIECLIDLQKGGRLVGIISHVPELKERIDARLEVTPAKEGSRARFVL